jgi:hypothetical protein
MDNDMLVASFFGPHPALGYHHTPWHRCWRSCSPVIQGAGHVDTSIWMVHVRIQKMSWMCYMLCLVAISCQTDIQNTSGVGGSSHYIHCTCITAAISFVLPQRLCTAPTHTVFSSWKQKSKLLQRISQVTCLVRQLTTLWFIYSESTRLEFLILNICSHEDHMHTDCPWK